MLLETESHLREHRNKERWVYFENLESEQYSS
jgi:hypothetical protein